jgi:hypothetical protein
MGAVGVSTRDAMPQRSGPSVTAVAPSPLPSDFRTTLAKVNPQRFVAAGHAGGRFDADVYVTPSAKAAAFGPDGRIEPGAVLVMDEVLHGTAAAGPVLMMEKRAPGFDPARGDWRYVVVDQGNVFDGALDPCAGCHNEAQHDHVFPLN